MRELRFAAVAGFLVVVGFVAGLAGSHIVGVAVVGDRMVVRAGERVASDGIVREGRSTVDTSAITGESMPVEIGPGDAMSWVPSTPPVR